MSVAHASGRDRTEPGARTARRALRAEKAQLVRWRRLLRARLDLTVAGLAPPPNLGESAWDVLPLAQLSLPRPDELTAALTVRPDHDPVELMERLRALDERLAEYGDELDQVIEGLTQDIVIDLGTAPACPRPEPHVGPSHERAPSTH